MNLTKFKPWNWFKKEQESHPIEVRKDNDLLPVLKLRRDLDRLFDEFFNRTWIDFAWPEANGNYSKLPSVDISETDSAYQIEVDLPGMDKENIELTVNDGVLKIKAQRQDQREEKGKYYHRFERAYGVFERTLSLPDDADQEKINATYKDGVLKIEVDKLPEAKSKTKRITIE